MASSQDTLTVRRTSLWKHAKRLLPTSRIDRFGFFFGESEDDDNDSLEPGELHRSAQPAPSVVKLEILRTHKWLDMLQNWPSIAKQRDGLLKQRVRKGVPDALRSSVWPLLSGGSDLKRQNPGQYAELLKKLPSRADMLCINLDLPRTYPNHFLFRVDDKEAAPVSQASALRSDDTLGRGQASLRNILRAAAVYDPGTGYCQGMAFVAGLLLSYLSEEDAFWTLAALLREEQQYGLAGLYAPGLPRFAELMHVFTVLVDKHLPRLAAHLTSLGVDHAMYASQWFITLFTYSAPFELVTRVWDMWLCEGWKAIFRTALALLKAQEATLLGLDFDDTMHALKQLCAASPVETVVQLGLKFPLTRERLEKMALEYRSAHAEELAARIASAKADAVRKEAMLADAETEKSLLARAAELEAAARHRLTAGEEEELRAQKQAKRKGSHPGGSHLHGRPVAGSTATVGTLPGSGSTSARGSPAQHAQHGHAQARMVKWVSEGGENGARAEAAIGQGAVEEGLGVGAEGRRPVVDPLATLPLEGSSIRPGSQRLYAVADDGTLLEIDPLEYPVLPVGIGEGGLALSEGTNNVATTSVGVVAPVAARPPLPVQRMGSDGTTSSSESDANARPDLHEACDVPTSHGLLAVAAYSIDNYAATVDALSRIHITVVTPTLEGGYKEEVMQSAEMRVPTELSLPGTSQTDSPLVQLASDALAEHEAVSLQNTHASSPRLGAELQPQAQVHGAGWSTTSDDGDDANRYRDDEGTARVAEMLDVVRLGAGAGAGGVGMEVGEAHARAGPVRLVSGEGSSRGAGKRSVVGSLAAGGYRSSAALSAHTARMASQRARADRKRGSAASGGASTGSVEEGGRVDKRAPFRLDLMHKDKDGARARGGPGAVTSPVRGGVVVGDMGVTFLGSPPAAYASSFVSPYVGAAGGGGSSPGLGLPPKRTHAHVLSQREEGEGQGGPRFLPIATGTAKSQPTDVWIASASGSASSPGQASRGTASGYTMQDMRA